MGGASLVQRDAGPLGSRDGFRGVEAGQADAEGGVDGRALQLDRLFQALEHGGDLALGGRHVRGREQQAQPLAGEAGHDGVGTSGDHSATDLAERFGRQLIAEGAADLGETLETKHGDDAVATLGEGFVKGAAVGQAGLKIGQRHMGDPLLALMNPRRHGVEAGRQPAQLVACRHRHLGGFTVFQLASRSGEGGDRAGDGARQNPAPHGQAAQADHAQHQDGEQHEAIGRQRQRQRVSQNEHRRSVAVERLQRFDQGDRWPRLDADRVRRGPALFHRADGEVGQGPGVRGGKAWAGPAAGLADQHRGGQRNGAEPLQLPQFVVVDFAGEDDPTAQVGRHDRRGNRLIGHIVDLQDAAGFAVVQRAPEPPRGGRVHTVEARDRPIHTDHEGLVELKPVAQVVDGRHHGRRVVRGQGLAKAEVMGKHAGAVRELVVAQGPYAVKYRAAGDQFAIDLLAGGGADGIIDGARDRQHGGPEEAAIEDGKPSAQAVEHYAVSVSSRPRRLGFQRSGSGRPCRWRVFAPEPSFRSWARADRVARSRPWPRPPVWP